MEDSIKNIILCFDNSNLSYASSEAAIMLARAFNAKVTGVHGYNAFMHEGAFRIMEPTLPAKFQKEEILQKQREIHSSLINVGMEKISLSYLNPMKEKFHAANVPFFAKVKQGKNFRALNELIAAEDGDLVVMGSSGFNSNGNGFIGSVCLRVMRNNNKNYLIIKKPFETVSKIVVGLDGSASAISALRTAKEYAEVFGAELHLVYVFDTNLHKDIFGRLKESVINKEGFSFNSREQEKLHDQFIDRGLARVGSMILDKAQKEVFTAGSSPHAHHEWGPVGETTSPSIVQKVLEGHIYRKLCDYAQEVEADMVFLGRTGRHFEEGVDIGSVTENVVRFSPCNVFIAAQEEFRGWEL